MVWLYSATRCRPRSRLRLALPLVNFHTCRTRSLDDAAARRLHRVRGVRADGRSRTRVNLTDGLDGLAIGPVIICSGTFLILAYAAGHDAARASTSPSTWRSRTSTAPASWRCSAARWSAPASASSGSTPTRRRCSWATSARWRWAARIGMLAVATKTELTLLIIGGVFVVEALSVIIQVA